MTAAAGFSVLAIDFGTSNTAAAFRDRNGQVYEVRLSTAGSLMPSGVFNKGGRLLVGRTALQAAFTDPEAFEPSPKRRLADREILLAGSMVSVTDLVGAVFADVLTRAGHVMAGPPDAVVITHPDQWSTPLQQLLAESAITAGVPPGLLRMVSESQAAAWYYAHSADDMPVGARLVVFDFGAGTCDVAVLDRQPDHTFTVVASDGLDGLGGQDMDARIHAWVRKQLAIKDPVLLAEINDPAAIASRLTLNDRIRDAKEALSEASSAAIVVAGAAATQVLQLTRDEFEELIAADIGRAVDLTERVMAAADSRQPSGQPPVIYLTGGSSSIPLVHARLAELGTLGALGDPKTVVVQGALYTPQASPRPPLPIPTPEPCPAPAARKQPPVPPGAAWVPNPSGRDAREDTVAAAVTSTPSTGNKTDRTQQPVPARPDNGAFGVIPGRTASSGTSTKNPSRKKWVIAGSSLVGVGVVTVVALLAGGVFTSHPATPPRPVPASALPSVMLDTGELNAIAHTSGMQAEQLNDHLVAVDATVSNKQCLGALYAGEPSIYTGSGYTGGVDRSFKVPASGGGNDVLVEQSIVEFPSADAASAFVKTSSQAWKACGGKAVTITSSASSSDPGAAYTWDIQALDTHDPTIVQKDTQEGGNGWECQRALRPYSNIGIDVMVCGNNLNTEATDIADKVATKAGQTPG